MTIDGELREAASEYRFLLDRGYPVDASLKLVGDRRRLSRATRICLYRGVSARSVSDGNRARLVPILPPGAGLCVDGYNVLFTILNYRRGMPLFLGTDGFLRDAGGLHGRIPDTPLFLEAVDLMAARLAALGTGDLLVVLDSPVSRSAEHAACVRTALAAVGLQGETTLAASADPVLKERSRGFLATSDSVVIAAARVGVFDLARNILEASYGTAFPDFGIDPESMPV